ncbi:hypothetical protein CAEBREN_24636 [Caenorhabditis brenneri]|uniref:L-Fucosyltransferase n=1 Tax=Caenorhabditis brenneri TaxID=135651 RepID=G0MWJ1_CAEBE|nr:hypothetical protein CAEBREN_24636 [Caenorhabditis brenneri]
MFIAPLQFHFGTTFAITFYRICGCLLVICMAYSFFNPVSQVVTTKFDKSYLNFAFRKKHITSVMSAKSRLGNHIFELAATLGISKSIGRAPVFYIQNLYYMKMLKETNETIPGLIDQFKIRYEEFPRNNRITTFNTRCCIYQDPDILKNIDDDLIILNGHYYQSPKYFPEMRKILRSYLKTPENEYRNLPKSTESNFINCVHVRRGDFARYDFHVSEPAFIKKALTYIEKQVAIQGKHVNTVLFGDDLQFMRQLIGNATELLTKAVCAFLL